MINILGWLGNIALLIGAILIAYKKRAGFLFNVVGLAFHISVGCLMRMNFLVKEYHIVLFVTVLWSEW